MKLTNRLRRSYENCMLPKCSTCLGLGRVSSSEETQGLSGRTFKVLEWRDCQECSGTGTDAVGRKHANHIAMTVMVSIVLIVLVSSLIYSCGR